MSYTKYLLSSLSLLNKKEALIYMDGGNIEGSGSSFLESFMASIFTLKHGTYLCIILQLVNLSVFDSCQFYVSSYFFIPVEECSYFPSHYVLGTHRVKYFQVTYHTTSCSREVSLQTIHL
jgi:hypothetical protein